MAIAGWRTITGIDGELFAVDGKAVAEYGAAKAVRLGAVEELRAEVERQGGYAGVFCGNIGTKTQ